MKIIDLFVKISKGEKVPKNIKYQDVIFEFDEDARQYYEENQVKDLNHSLRSWLSDFNYLNEEIEIIEEDKKINFEEIEELTCNPYDFEKQTINSLIKNQRKLIYEVNRLKGEK